MSIEIIPNVSWNLETYQKVFHNRNETAIEEKKITISIIFAVVEVEKTTKMKVIVMSQVDTFLIKC